MSENIVHIDLGERSYDIVIAADLLTRLEQHIPFNYSGKKFFLITDENVVDYAKLVEENLLSQGADFADTLSLPFGEGTKSYAHLTQVHNWMLERNIHRNSIVVAVGGGVIGDLAGFAAATVLRGVPFIQIPTTLLAQVDSSVGGKTGINSLYGKNLVGAFYQPVCVITDINTLHTLPKRELLAGYAEVVKYGLIADLNFFEWLEENASRVLDLDTDAVSYAIQVSCKAKAKIVEADERESGKRALLNLGHTFGHALEAAAGYDGTLLHGEGVSIGTMMAFDLSVRMGLCPQADYDRVRSHFVSIGLPVSVDVNKIDLSVDSMIKTMLRDKKAVDNNMVFILTRGIGQAFVSKEVPEDLVRSVLKDFIEES